MLFFVFSFVAFHFRCLVCVLVLKFNYGFSVVGVSLWCLFLVIRSVVSFGIKLYQLVGFAV